MRLVLDYQFKAPGRLYLALPQDDSAQSIGTLTLSRRPLHTYITGQTLVASFALSPGDALHLRTQVVIRLPSPVTCRNPLQLDSENPLYPSGAPFEALARSIVRDAQGHQKVERLVRYLSRTLRPSPSPDVKGALHVLERGSGDALDYAFLLLSLCRSLGLPARPVFGLLAGRSKPHAWIEVCHEQSWLSFDPFAYQAVSENPAWLLDIGAAPEPEHYLGSHEGLRLTFSRETFVPLHEDEGTGKVPFFAHRVLAGDRVLAWGLEPLLGTAPYLAPAYPLAEEPSNMLHESEKISLDFIDTKGHLRQILPWLRSLVFVAALLSILGLTIPLPLALSAYSLYAADLSLLQGRALLHLLASPRILARMRAWEILSLQAFMIFVLTGYGTLWFGLAFVVLFTTGRLTTNTATT